MGTLSQVVAIEKPVKSAAYADLTQANSMTTCFKRCRGQKLTTEEQENGK